MTKILRYRGRATIDTFEDLPQWLIYYGTKDYKGKTPDESNYIIPMTGDNYQQNDKDNAPKTDRFGMLFDFLKKVFAFIMSLFNK